MPADRPGTDQGPHTPQLHSAGTSPCLLYGCAPVVLLYGCVVWYVQVAQQVNQYQSKIKDTTRKTMALVSELTMKQVYHPM